MKNIIVFFRPDKKYGEFSNWYIRNFYVEGIKYNCMEQYMMASKALLFEDDTLYNQIMNCTEPFKMKQYGRLVTNFDQDIWDNKKYDIMRTGLYCKFSQNKDLKKLLLSTENKFIGECNKFDKIWGTGLTVFDMINNNYDIDNLPGYNLLGKLLIDVRKELRTRA